jgi:hypothetical protein
VYKPPKKILHFLKSHLRAILNKLLSFFGYIRDEPILTEMLDNHIRLSSEQIAANVKANNALVKQFMDKAYPRQDNEEYATLEFGYQVPVHRFDTFPKYILDPENPPLKIEAGCMARNELCETIDGLQMPDEDLRVEYRLFGYKCKRCGGTNLWKTTGAYSKSSLHCECSLTRIDAAT